MESFQRRYLPHTYLAVGARSCWDLSGDCQVEHLDSASPRGLGFLTAWQLQNMWPSYMVAQVSEGRYPKRTRRKLCAVFSPSPVCLILLVMWESQWLAWN